MRSRRSAIVSLLYLGTAHVALALATLLAALRPQAVAGFFYHAWMAGLVHLVTLGWITFSIIGAMYIVGPYALRMDMRARRMDYVAYAFALIGLIGMVAHFWIQEYGGMAWSAGTIACGILYATSRIVVAVRRAKVHPAVKLHVTLACVNVWIAASTGVLIGWDKVAHFLPGFVLANVFAHAHLAAIGWALMMVVGVGYRLLPMTFPSRIPSGRAVYASAIFLEVGVLGLFVTLLLRSDWAIAFGAIILCGLMVFAGHVVLMLREHASKPIGAPRVDFGVLHAAGAGVWMIVAAALGMTLLIVPPSIWSLHAAAAYGVVGLVGFLAQMVLAMEARLVPVLVWFRMYAASGYGVPPPLRHTMRDRSLQAIVYFGWTLGVPTLAAGMFLESAQLVGLGAWSLFAGVALATVDNVLVVHSAISASTTRFGNSNGAIGGAPESILSNSVAPGCRRIDAA